MAKKVVSVALHKKNPIKQKSSNINKKLRNVLKNIANYMKSDTYMYSLMDSPKSLSSAFLGEESYEPTRKNENDLLKEIEAYLKSDNYLYAPLVNHPAEGMADKSSRCDKLQQTTEDVGRINRQIAVKHVHVENATVKRIVRGSSYVPGEELLQKVLGKTGADSIR